MDGEAPAASSNQAGEVPRPPAPAPTLVETMRRAPAATLIVAINVVVFVLVERAGSTTSTANLIRFGALWRDLVWQGQYWRLATAMFLHIGGIHLMCNAYYGFRISTQVERETGTWKFLALYLLSGLSGSALSVIGHRVVSAGASGALFGLIGWQVMAQRARLGSFRALWDDPRARRELTWIGAWFIIGVFARFDNYAHAGGLAFGVLFAWALLAPPPSRRRRLAVALGGAVALILLALRPLPVIHREDRALRAASSSQDPATIVALTDGLLDSSRRLEVLQVRSRGLLSLGRYQEARDEADEVIAKLPSSAFAYVLRGGARFMLGDRAGAEADFQQALALDSTSWSRDTIAWYRRQPPFTAGEPGSSR